LSLIYAINVKALSLHQIKVMKLLLLTLGLLALGFAGIAIKIWAKKDGKFAGTCASQNPMLNKDGEACGFCGKTPDQFENCNETQHS
tara:strand:+ start:220 stop:480 length:261 start_codon:yes stop_codon:yes gene_type:complete